MRDVGSKATPEVIRAWVEVYDLFRGLEGDRQDRLNQVAQRLGVTYKVARRRLRNYEAMNGVRLVPPPRAQPAPPSAAEQRAGAGGREGLADRRLACADCGERFTWSAAEQAFFREQGFQEPRRCKPCRQAKKGQRGVDRPGGGGKAA